MAIRNGPLWDKVLKIAVCLGLFLAFWGVQWVIPDFYQELFRLSLAGDVDGLINYISSFGIYAALISIFMITVTDMTGLPSIPFLTVNGPFSDSCRALSFPWVGEVLGTELSFVIMRTILRRQAIHVISRHHLRNQLDKYSCFPTLAVARSIPYIPNVPFTALLPSVTSVRKTISWRRLSARFRGSSSKSSWAMTSSISASTAAAWLSGSS